MEEGQDSGTASSLPKGHGLARAAATLEYVRQGLSKDDFLKEAEYAYQMALEQQSRREKDLSEEEVEKALQEAESAPPDELLQLLDWYAVRDHKKLETDAMRRERLRYHLKKQVTSCRSVAELLGNVQTNAECFQRASESLSKTANDILKFARDRACTDTRLRECIDRDFAGWQEQLQMSVSRLEKKECLILVTGEVSVGKTSFLNLLFEGEIANFQLPHNERETTSCICEIRYGPHKRVVAYRDKPQPGESETIEITHEDVTRERLDELINYDQFRQSGNKVPFKKIEIFVPAEFLKNGLVLVDTPGIGHDRQDMVQYINEYLQHSVGFIYVLTNALNVHKLCKLFELDKSRVNMYICEDDEVEELTDRLARQTLFVANKWDLIEDEDVMMKELVDKVKKYWLTDGDGQAKVLKLAAKNDRQHFASGYLSDRLCDVIAAFEKIVLHNMMLQLRRHYRVLQFICAKIEYHCQRYLNVASLKDVNQLQEVQKEAAQKLQTVNQAGKKAITNFQLSMDAFDISSMVNSLERYLKVPEVRAKIVNWSEEECPELLTDYTKLEAAAKRKVEARIKKVVEEWEHENHHLENARQTISDQMRQYLKDVDANISTIARTLTPIRPVEIDPPGFHFRFASDSLSYIVLCIKSFLSEVFFFMNVDKQKLEMFSQHPVKAMEEMAVNMYHNLLQKQGKSLKKVLSNVLGLEQVKTIFKEHVNTAIANAAKEVEDLRSREASRSFRNTYTPVRNECLALHTSLLGWELEFLMAGESIESKGIEVKRDLLLGSGIAAGYYPGKNLAEGKLVTVKRFAKKDDLRTILQDYKCLKKHKSAHIGTVLGMTKVEADQSIELVLVMEQAMWSLEDWLNRNIQDLGAYKQTSETTRQYLQVGHDISMGLTALHEAGYVHGDLRPSTVLITENGQEGRRYRAKLFHFGIRTGLDIPVTSANLSLALDRYSAPERVEETTFQPAMDIYSLGKILCDLWFGTETRPFLRRDKLSQLRKLDGSSEASEQPFSASVQETVTKDYEPIPPPKSYEELVRECCRSSPMRRPHISAIASRLEGVMSDLCDTPIN